MAFLSVIIPFYNKHAYIKRCIHSVLEQQVPEIEIIVVDDGSDIALTKGMLEISDHSLLRIFRISNSGPGYARNFGASKSTSVYLLFLDADDFLNEDSLHFFCRDYKQYQADCFLYSFKYLSMENSCEPFMKDETDFESCQLILNNSNLPRAVDFFAAGSTVISRTMFSGLGGYFSRYNARFGEDAYLWIQVLLSDCRLFRSRYCFVSIDDSASELGIATKKNRPVPVFLTEFRELKNKIPVAKLKLFSSWIHFHFGLTSIRLINENRMSEFFQIFLKHPSLILKKGIALFFIKKTLRRIAS